MMALRRSLRRGSVWLDHSLSFRERDPMLIPLADRAVQRDEQVELLGMPKSAVAFLAPLLAKLMAGMSAVAEAQRRSKVEIGADGMLQLPAITALADLAEPVRTRETIHNLIGSVQVPDMLREVAVTVRRVSLAAMERGRRRIGPAHFSHINVRGTMRFGVEQYAQALVRRGPACAARVASWQGWWRQAAMGQILRRLPVLATIVKSHRISP